MLLDHGAEVTMQDRPDLAVVLATPKSEMDLVPSASES